MNRCEILILLAVFSVIGFYLGLNMHNDRIDAEVAESLKVKKLQEKIKFLEEYQKLMNESEFEMIQEHGDCIVKSVRRTLKLIDTLKNDCRDNDYLQRELWRLIEDIECRE